MTKTKSVEAAARRQEWRAGVRAGAAGLREGRIVTTNRLGIASRALRIVTACALIAFIASCAAPAPRATGHPPHGAELPPPPVQPIDVAPPVIASVPDAVGAPPPPVHIAHAARPPTAALAAPPPPAKYKVVDVLYATDRLRIAGTGGLVGFSGGRGAAIEYGTCEVSIPDTHREGELESPGLLEFHEDPARHVVLLAVQPASHDAFVGDLAARVAAAPGRTALVFVHGYNVTFEDAARRTAQIAYDIHFAGVPMFFSWPSLGETLAYPIDMTNADWAQFDLKTLLLDIAKELENAIPADAPHGEDVRLLRSQASRCRDILSKITELSSSGAPFDRTPITSLIEEVVAPHRDFDVTINVSAPSERETEPVGARNPAIIYGLGNLLENAVDFAREQVDVVTQWDDATIEITGLPQKMGPTSSISSAFILHSVFVAAAEQAVAAGGKPEVWGSANSDATNNEALLRKYKGVIRHL